MSEIIFNVSVLLSTAIFTSVGILLLYRKSKISGVLILIGALFLFVTMVRIILGLHYPYIGSGQDNLQLINDILTQLFRGSVGYALLPIAVGVSLLVRPLNKKGLGTAFQPPQP